MIAEAAEAEGLRQADGFELAGQAIKIGEEIEVFLHGQIGIEVEPLRHVADVLFDPLWLAYYVVAGDDRGALGGGERATQHTDGCRLASSIRPDQSEDLPWPNREFQMLHGRDPAVVSCQTTGFDGVFHCADCCLAVHPSVYL